MLVILAFRGLAGGSREAPGRPPGGRIKRLRGRIKRLEGRIKRLGGVLEGGTQGLLVGAVSLEPSWTAPRLREGVTQGLCVLPVLERS